MQLEIGLIDSGEDAHYGTGIVKQVVADSIDLTQIALKRQAGEIQRLKDEKIILQQEVDFYKSQFQALSGFIESITNKGQAFLKDAASCNWVNKLNTYLNEVSSVGRVLGVFTTPRTIDS